MKWRCFFKRNAASTVLASVPFAAIAHMDATGYCYSDGSLRGHTHIRHDGTILSTAATINRRKVVKYVCKGGSVICSFLFFSETTCGPFLRRFRQTKFRPIFSTPQKVPLCGTAIHPSCRQCQCKGGVLCTTRLLYYAINRVSGHYCVISVVSIEY